jgi:hypothetical protein
MFACSLFLPNADMHFTMLLLARRQRFECYEF